MSNNINLTTRADIRNRIWQLSYPAMVSMLLQTVYDLVDMAWVGQISKQAIAAVTIFSTIFWLFLFFNELIGASSVSMISQNYGKGDKEMTRLVSEQTMSFKVFMGFISGVLMYFTINPLLNFYLKNPSTVKLAMDYGYIRIFFLPAMYASYSVNTIFRCQGDPKTPMKIMIFSTILNIILDPILMFETIPFTNIPGFNMGVKGAGAATVISVMFSLIYGLSILLSGKNEIYVSLKGLFKLNWNIDLDLLKIGLPNALKQFAGGLFMAIMVKFVSHYGDSVITAVGIIAKLQTFIYMPVNGLMMGGSIVVGHFLGRREIENAETSASIASRINFLTMAFFSILFAIFPQYLFSIFNKDPEIIQMGKELVPIVTLTIPLTGYAFGQSIVFMGSGYTKPYLVGSLVSQWLLQLPFVAICVYVLKLSYRSIAFSFPLADIVYFVIILIFFKSGKWKTMDVTKKINSNM